MKQKKLETFNCDNPACGIEVTRPVRATSRIGKRMRFCSPSCSISRMNHTVGRYY